MATLFNIYHKNNILFEGYTVKDIKNQFKKVRKSSGEDLRGDLLAVYDVRMVEMTPEQIEDFKKSEEYIDDLLEEWDIVTKDFKDFFKKQRGVHNE